MLAWSLGQKKDFDHISNVYFLLVFNKHPYIMASYWLFECRYIKYNLSITYNMYIKYILRRIAAWIFFPLERPLLWIPMCIYTLVCMCFLTDQLNQRPLFTVLHFNENVNIIYLCIILSIFLKCDSRLELYMIRFYWCLTKQIMLPRLFQQSNGGCVLFCHWLLKVH